MSDNPSRAEPDWPAAVVASAFLTGVLVARSLERRGVRVIIIDCDTSLHAFRSVYGQAIQCPNPDSDPVEWLAFMRDLAKSLGGQPVLVAASDQYVTAIGRFADELLGFFRFSPSATTQAELAVKEGQVRLAEKFGLPYPRTEYAESESQVRAFAGVARFPLVVKPRQQRYWGEASEGHPLHSRKLVRADDEASLLAVYRMAAQFSPEVILQEMVEAPDTSKRVYVGIYRQDGERVASMTLKELRCLEYQLPTVIEPVLDPEVEAICDRFFRSIGYRGTGEIEVIWDERDNVPKMMDINPRFTGSGDALPAAGIDQAWLVYLDLIGVPVTAVQPERSDFRHVMVCNEAHALRLHLARGQLTWAEVRRTYRRPVYLWDLDLRDWRLAGRAIWNVSRVLAGGLIRAVLGKRSRAEKVSTTVPLDDMRSLTK